MLDVLAARLYYYYSLSYERTDSLADIRGTLLALHQTATLRHDELGQETLLNLLLRNYLHYNLYDQAEKLRSKTLRSDSHSNQQVNSRRRSLHPCRSLYLCCVVQYFHSRLWLVAMSHPGGYLL
jgi:hypothetical protein